MQYDQEANIVRVETDNSCYELLRTYPSFRSGFVTFLWFDGSLLEQAIKHLLTQTSQSFDLVLDILQLLIYQMQRDNISSEKYENHLTGIRSDNNFWRTFSIGEEFDVVDITENDQEQISDKSSKQLMITYQYDPTNPALTFENIVKQIKAATTSQNTANFPLTSTLFKLTKNKTAIADSASLPPSPQHTIVQQQKKKPLTTRRRNSCVIV